MRAQTSLVIAGLAFVVAACGPSPESKPNPVAALPSAPPATIAGTDDQEANKRQIDARIEELERRISESDRKLEEARKDLAALRSKCPPVAPRADDPPGTIRGVVQACDNDVEIVIVSAGARDGVSVGSEFAVTRVGETVATIVIEKVFPNYSSGSFKPGTPKRAIVPGDECVGRARTDLPK